MSLWTQNLTFECSLPKWFSGEIKMNSSCLLLLLLLLLLLFYLDFLSQTFTIHRKAGEGGWGGVGGLFL